MPETRLLSWNVNGIRAAHRKGFTDWMAQEKPDILCIQETKAHPDQLPRDLTHMAGYQAHYSSAIRRGYSGVATYSRRPPLAVSSGIGIDRFDSEGRILVTTFDEFTVFNIYFPNGKSSPERLQYKMDFYSAFLDHVTSRLRQGEKIVICGDVNTAHTAIDLARPRENENISGFLPEERAWIDHLIDSGFIDTFRFFEKGGDHYTWWDYKTRARERNTGWRIDYFFVSENLAGQLTSACILSDVPGSDHCPIGIGLTF